MEEGSDDWRDDVTRGCTQTLAQYRAQKDAEAGAGRLKGSMPTEPPDDGHDGSEPD